MFPQLVAAVRARISLASMMFFVVCAQHENEFVGSPIETTTMDDVIFGGLVYVPRQMGLLVKIRAGFVQGVLPRNVQPQFGT